MKFKFRYVVIVLIIVVLYPIMNLSITDNKVSKSLLTHTYYVNIASDETDFEVLSLYLIDQGWLENEEKLTEGIHVFEKEGKEKIIANSKIRTLLIDGKLNFQKLRTSFFKKFE